MTALYELEEVDLRNPGLTDWLRISASWVWPWFEERGARVLAAWNTVVGPGVQAVLLYEYPDLGAYERTRVALAGGRDRPAVLDEADTYVLHRRTRLMAPSAHRPIGHVARDGVFTLRTFQIDPARVDDYHRLTAELVWPHGEEHRLGAFLGLWNTVCGEGGEVVFISRYDDLAHWERTHPAAGIGGSGEVTEWWEKQRERNRLIRSTAVSVMQRLPAWPSRDAALAG